MKRIPAAIILGLLIPWCAKSQKITNVQAFQEDNKAIIMYDLLSIDEAKEFYVKVFCSNDEGKTYGPALSYVAGDANTVVKPGTSKKIIWDLLKESQTASGNFVFRVDATSVGDKGVLPSLDDNKGMSLQFLDVTRSGSDVSLIMSISNKTSASAQVILANLIIVDDHDKIYRDFSGDVNKPIQIPAGDKKVVIVNIKNVNPAAKAFSQLDFNVSSIIARLKNIPIITEN